MDGNDMLEFVPGYIQDGFSEMKVTNRALAFVHNRYNTRVSVVHSREEGWFKIKAMRPAKSGFNRFNDKDVTRKEDFTGDPDDIAEIVGDMVDETVLV